MFNRIIEICMRNRLLVLAVFIIIILAGWWALKNTPVDAIPDIGENQVIVFADWPGRSPQDIEDQVVYPLSIAMQGIPDVKYVRSTSMFSFGYINIIFKDFLNEFGDLDTNWTALHATRFFAFQTARGFFQSFFIVGTITVGMEEKS